MVEPETAPHCVISWLELHHVGAVLARNRLRIRQQSAGCLPTASGSAVYETRPSPLLASSLRLRRYRGLPWRPFPRPHTRTAARIATLRARRTRTRKRSLDTGGPVGSTQPPGRSATWGPH